MILKEYLNTKPIEECFDLYPSKYKGRSLYLYEDAEITSIENNSRNVNRKIIKLNNGE